MIKPIMNYWLEDLNDEILTDWFVSKHRQNNFVMEEKYKHLVLSMKRIIKNLIYK